MTIAISIKVNDGVVLAADSASTLLGEFPGGKRGVVNIYNNANKVFNLYKGKPIGAITWGVGSIGPSSIETLMKDFRRDVLVKREYGFEKDSYTIKNIADRFKAFIYDEHFVRVYGDPTKGPPLGFVIAGYSTGSGYAEEYSIDIRGGVQPVPVPLRQEDECGVTWFGEIEAISRILYGYGTGLETILIKDLSVPKESIAPVMSVITKGLACQVVSPPMPIQDAIDLARFLVELTIQFCRFRPGALTVGGPVEIAAITKHEGFKWISRKYYYSRLMNPKERHYHDDPINVSEA